MKIPAIIIAVCMVALVAIGGALLAVEASRAHDQHQYDNQKVVLSPYP